MSLPVRTTEDDVMRVVDYLKTKATGATVPDAKAALGKKVLDGRKIRAYTAWGLVAKEGQRLKLDPLGRDLSRAKPDQKPLVFLRVVRNIKPYLSALEWMFHQGFKQITSVDVAAHWHEHHKESLGTEDEIGIKLMAVCFFHLCQAADLGTLVIGRKGQATRFEISRESLGQFVGERALLAEEPVPEEPSPETPEEEAPAEEEARKVPAKRLPRVFIAHSKNMEIVEQVKTMLELADFEFEIAEEQEEPAIPVPEKVLSAMRNCTAAVISVTADENEKRDDGTYGINQNVLIEIGAAFVLYNRKVVLVWDKRVAVPSNLQGLYRCEFSGDDLSWSAGMKLMKAVNKFKSKGLSEASE